MILDCVNHGSNPTESVLFDFLVQTIGEIRKPRIPSCNYDVLQVVMLYVLRGEF